MNSNHTFDRKKALFLADCCKLAHDQKENHGKFPVPKGYTLVSGFKGTSFQDKEWFGFVIKANDDSHAVVSYRGTNTRPEWLEDACAFQHQFPYYKTPLYVHDGFFNVYDSIRPSLIKIFKSDKMKNIKEIWITGHSLGGGLSTLHAFDFAYNDRSRNYSLINFASPRVGNPEFAQTFNKVVRNSFRVVNIYDIVPHLPPKELELIKDGTIRTCTYKHVNTSILFGIRAGSISENHKMDTYIKGISNMVIRGKFT
jgi:triacylglycerol lipase